MNIIKDFRNDLLKRREVKVVFNDSSNPGYEGALKKLCEGLKVLADVSVVKSLKGNYGSGNFSVDAFIYDSVEDKKRVEPLKREKKK